MDLNTFIYYAFFFIAVIVVIRFGWFALQKLSNVLGPILFKKRYAREAEEKQRREQFLAELTLKIIKDDIEEERATN